MKRIDYRGYLKRLLMKFSSEQSDTLKVIGRCEWCHLKEFNIGWINARIATGSRTSVLYVSGIRMYHESGNMRVEFVVGRDEEHRNAGILCHATVVDQKEFKGPDGSRERKWIIRSPVSLGESTWTIPIALSSQQSADIRITLGRNALQGRFIVDASKSYLMGEGKSKDLP